VNYGIECHLSVSESVAKCSQSALHVVFFFFVGFNWNYNYLNGWYTHKFVGGEVMKAKAKL